MYTPRGAALLYVSPRWQPYVQPASISHAFRSEYLSRMAVEGTRDESSYVAAVAAAVFMDMIGRDRIRMYTTSLRKQAESMLAEAWGTSNDDDAFIVPEDMRGTMSLIKSPIKDDINKGGFTYDPNTIRTCDIMVTSGSTSGTGDIEGMNINKSMNIILRGKEIGPHGGSEKALTIQKILLNQYNMTAPPIR